MDQVIIVINLWVCKWVIGVQTPSRLDVIERSSVTVTSVTVSFAHDKGHNWLTSGDILLYPFEIALSLGLWSMVIVEQLVSDLEVIKSWTNVHGTNFVANGGISMRPVLIGSMLPYEVHRDVCPKILSYSLNGSRTTESSCDLPLLSWSNIGYLRVFSFGRTANTWSNTALINLIRVCHFIQKDVLGIHLRRGQQQGHS